jgi:glycosyltransferase involved in cell wall biosynthesis
VSRYVFVTQELDPIAPGGAGAVIAGIASRLAREHEVVVILATDLETGLADLPFRLVTVATEPADGTIEWFIERSRRLAVALADIAGEGRPIHLVEFTDFEAPAWWALTNRHELGLTGVPIGLRLHGPGEAITEAIGAPARPPLDRLGDLERLSFGMADLVLVPSASMASWARQRYELEADRLIVAPPPVPEVARRRWQPPEFPLFAGLGRLHEQKGWQDLIPAITPVMDAYDEARLLVIGSDGWSRAQDRPMSEVLRDAVPERHRSRVDLPGRLAREEALDRLAGCTAVVLPSRFETFCLALHEARRAGLPVVAPDLPAYADHGEGLGLLRYDGTVAGLTTVLMQIVTDRSILERLAGEPAPRVGDPVAAYLGRIPSPRHENSQAGLATAAVHQFEALLAPGRKKGAGVARTLLRMLPRPVASLAMRVLPRRVKDRFRDVASWPAEVERRARAARRSAVEEGIRRGRYPVHDRPRVSVVIPCFNQGEFLGEALVSVFEQAFDQWEVVVVDDGSTDVTTREIIDAIDWPRVTVVRQENSGLPAARNRGIARAGGEFVVPLDADDELLPLYMGQMVEALERSPEAGYAHCWAEWFGDFDRVWATRPFNAYGIRISNSVFGGALIRRAALDAVGGYDATMTAGNEDWELWLRMLEAGYGQVQVRQPLYRYRRHGLSMSVGTEANFEAGLQALVERHPGLYDPEPLRLAKRLHYPAVSIVTPSTPEEVTADYDIEVLAGDDICALAHRSRGKYLLQMPEGGAVDGAVLDTLVDRLESAPSLAAAREGDMTLMRRWAVVDPDAPLEKPDGLPECPDADWRVPPRLPVAGRLLEVVRQRPEVPARIPEWLAR